MKMSTPRKNVAIIAPARDLMCVAAHRPNEAEPPAAFTRATMMPSMTRKTKMPAFHGSLIAWMNPTSEPLSWAGTIVEPASSMPMSTVSPLSVTYETIAPSSNSTVGSGSALNVPHMM